ncbi:MAG TPA: ankyrin repeat domain-containing protein [Solirubrobacteraceae bacterium]|nr:ankyrin repeat domain-containing protein [Solirubrobacteraceae bacterium]
MPPRGLPGNANLEQLRNGAKSFQRAVRAGDAGAAKVVREFHPRLADAQPGSPELGAFSRADALLVVARGFDFPSWPRLKSYLETVAAYARSPHDQPVGGPVDTEEQRADEFLRLACLNYGDDDPARRLRAAELLADDPGLAAASLYTAAAAGDTEAVGAFLERDPAAANRQGGPFDWTPLVYAAYARVGDRPLGPAAVQVAERLLNAGADPNAGYLWEGLSPPFTALTGALGSGGGDAPSRDGGLALARLLLQRGADPNDSQALYNEAGTSDDAWIELLLEFGLGTGDGGPWRPRLAPALESPREMVEDALTAAASNGFAHRVRLLLDHGADPNGHGTRHPIYHGRSALEEAALHGHDEIVAVLEAAGARDSLDAADRFICAATAGDRAGVDQMLHADPSVREQAIQRRPEQIVRAAGSERLDAVALLIELGFDVNALDRTSPLHVTALHMAAERGSLAVIQLLVEHGADPTVRDSGYDSTPAGWAQHFGRADAHVCLAALEGRAR